MTIYERFLKELFKLESEYNITVAGKSEMGENIYALKRGNPKVLFTGAIHAREYLSAFLMLNLARLSCYDFEFIPMLNPDGVRLATEGIGYALNLRNKINANVFNLIAQSDLNLWKANLNAVDLNVNFDARWSEGKNNLRHIASENYVGPYPFSEKETLVAKDRSLDKSLVLCYHLKGEEIYYGFDNNKGIGLAKKLSQKTGYTAKRIAGSCGGHKDWFIQKGYGEGLTIEVGDDRLSHPVGLNHLNEITNKNKCILDILKETNYV